MAKKTARTRKPGGTAKKGSRPAPKRASKTASRTTKRAPARKRSNWSWGKVSPERKLDILGIALALVGLLTLLSLLSPSHGTVTGAWVQLLSQVAGWGTFVLPLALLIVGLWLLFRNIEKLPLLSGVRLTGIVLIYLNLLAFLHLLGGGGRELAQTGQGGGYVGFVFERLLKNSIGTAGTVVALIAWLLIALAFSFDLSLTDLFGPLVERTRRAWRERKEFAGSLSDGNTPVSEWTPFADPPASNELPSDFRPLSGRKGSSSSAGAAAVPAPRSGSASLALDADSADHDPIPPAPAPDGPGWAVPGVDVILDPAEPVFTQANQDLDRAKIIEETLAAFGAPAHVVETHRGPTVTQFGVEPDFVESRGQKMRVRVSKIVALTDDIALALAAPRIRIQAPVPGRNYVGIEVPNAEVTRVTLYEVMESELFLKILFAASFRGGQGCFWQAGIV